MLVADPAARVVAGPEIPAYPELQALLLQRFLDEELAAVLDEGRDAVAQQLGDGEERVELALALRAGLAEEVAAARVADQPVRGAVTGVDVGVDEPRCDEPARGVELAVDASLEGGSDVQDLVALEHHLVLAVERMRAAFVTDDPAAANPRPHRAPQGQSGAPASTACARCFVAS